MSSIIWRSHPLIELDEFVWLAFFCSAVSGVLAVTEAVLSGLAGLAVFFDGFLGLGGVEVLVDLCGLALLLGQGDAGEGEPSGEGA